MKKVLIVLLVSGLGWVSCVKPHEVKRMTETEMQQKVDSIVAERSRELEIAGKVDLNLRYKIEVKVKADSILNARKLPVAKDSSRPNIPLQNARIQIPKIQNIRSKADKTKPAE